MSNLFERRVHFWLTLAVLVLLAHRVGWWGGALVCLWTIVSSFADSHRAPPESPE